MGVVGLGIDLVDLDKMKKIISGKSGNRFLENTFTEDERKCAGKNPAKYATAFAIKEATYKAFGTGWIEGKDVEIVRCGNGPPEIVLHGEIKKISKKRKIKKILASPSYTERQAVAVVLLIS